VKVPISDYAVVDLDAPVLLAYERVVDGATNWVVWCSCSQTWYSHGPAEGHREAHCLDPASPYWRTGYNLAFAGKWEER
jgi:hypothetical protein